MTLPPLNLGTVSIAPPILLAPMAGYTDSAFRLLCREMGCGLTFTEMVSAEGMAVHSARTLHYLETLPGDHPVAAHLYGARLEPLAEACRQFSGWKRFVAIDLNCGCPVPKVRRRGAGVGLMEHPDRLRDIVAAMVGAGSLPVTIKTRLGTAPGAETQLEETALAAQEGGACAISVHARYATQRHSGPVAWERLSRLKQKLTIPLIGNGGIEDPVSALDLMRQTGLDGLMIGRAAVGQPWIFKDFISNHGERYTPSPAERYAMIRRHLLLSKELAGSYLRTVRMRRRNITADQLACMRFRSHIFRYLRGRRHIAEFARHIHTLPPVIEAWLAAARRFLDLDDISTHASDMVTEAGSRIVGVSRVSRSPA